MARMFAACLAAAAAATLSAANRSLSRAPAALYATYNNGTVASLDATTGTATNVGTFNISAGLQMTCIDDSMGVIFAMGGCCKEPSGIRFQAGLQHLTVRVAQVTMLTTMC